MRASGSSFVFQQFHLVILDSLYLIPQNPLYQSYFFSKLENVLKTYSRPFSFKPSSRFPHQVSSIVTKCEVICVPVLNLTLEQYSWCRRSFRVCSFFGSLLVPIDSLMHCVISFCHRNQMSLYVRSHDEVFIKSNIHNSVQLFRQSTGAH